MLHIFLLCTLLLFILHISFRIITCIIIVSIKYMIDIAIVFSLCTNNNSSTIYVEWCAICRNFLSLFFIFYYLHYHNNFELYLSHSNLRRVVSAPTRYFLIPNFFFPFLLILHEGWRRGLYRCLAVLVVKSARGRKKNKWEKKFQPHIGAKNVGAPLEPIVLVFICPLCFSFTYVHILHSSSNSSSRNNNYNERFSKKERN